LTSRIQAIHIEIENIYACNLHCVHCARQYIDRIGTKKISHDLFNNSILEAVAIRTRAIGLAIWGEVFLDKDVFEQIVFAKTHGILDIRLHQDRSLDIRNKTCRTCLGLDL
jgi:MoaA/NifB/PqqE/SkfB family radical SAM enzyme